MSVRQVIVAGSCFIVIAGIGLLYFSHKKQLDVRDNTLSVYEIPEGWKEYRSSAHHFSLSYPEELLVSEHSEGGGASTIIFQNIEQGIGFQIFVVPYTEQQISEERFKKDVPSGVRMDLENIIIDTATRATFYSLDAFLGETREIWFIKDGWLYEVTTLRALDQWLSDVMLSWRFI